MITNCNKLKIYVLVLSVSGRETKGKSPYRDGVARTLCPLRSGVLGPAVVRVLSLVVVRLTRAHRGATGTDQHLFV